MCAPGHDEPEGSHACPRNDAWPWRPPWLPFGVCNIQDMETSPRAVDHIMGPRTHLGSELLGDVLIRTSRSRDPGVRYYTSTTCSRILVTCTRLPACCLLCMLYYWAQAQQGRARWSPSAPGHPSSHPRCVGTHGISSRGLLDSWI